MYFSKKKPLEIKFVDIISSKSRDVQIDASKKIQMYRNILKKDKSMNKDLKEEIDYQIRKYRGRIKFNPIKRTRVKLNYKNVEITIPVNIYGFVSPSSFQKYKTKIKKVLREKREASKKVAKDFKKIEGVIYELSGGVHSSNNSIYDLFRQIARKRVNSMRKPEAMNNHVGVEIEFYSKYDRDNICDRLIDAKLSKYARIMTDNSIQPTEEKPRGFELCLVAPENKISNIIERACDLLSEIEAESNESCGLHVHLDARNRNKELLFYNLVQCQDLMFKMTLPSRKTNGYCRQQRSSNWREASENHYDAINKSAYKKHKTIEVRTHHGTVNYREISNWVNFLTKVANYNEELGKMDNLSKVHKILKFDKKLNTYFKEKIKMFGT